MSHKQLYTKTIHLNLRSITDMGMIPILIKDKNPFENNDYFNSVLRIGTEFGHTDFLKFIPKDAEVVSMTAINKYFFLYETKGLSSLLDVTFEPYISTVQSPYGALYDCKSLCILIKGPSKEQIPDHDKLY